MAVTVRVGQALGRGEPREARFAAGVGMGTALAYACLSCSLMLVFREQIAAIYTPDPVVIHLASMLIVFSALFQFSDSIQVTAAGALRGYQDTRVTMVLTLFAYWGVGLPVGYALGLTDWLGEPSGPSGLWQGLIVGRLCGGDVAGAPGAQCTPAHSSRKGAGLIGFLADPVQVGASIFLLIHQFVAKKHAEFGNISTGRRVGGDHLEQAARRQVTDVLVQHHHRLRTVEAGGVEGAVNR